MLDVAEGSVKVFNVFQGYPEVVEVPSRALQEVLDWGKKDFVGGKLS